MELKKTPRGANQFWKIFHKRKLIILIITETLITFLTGVVLIILNVFQIQSIIFWIFICVFFLVILGSNIVLFERSVQPIHDFMAIILNISGERTNLKPLNPNTEKYGNSGFNDAIKILYQIASNQSTDSINSNNETNDNKDSQIEIEKALNESLCGFAALNNKGEIIYANNATPIYINKDGSKSLSLIFNSEDTLEKWLNECDKNAVRSDHMWTRVPDKLPNEENRRFFDVIASYQKGATAETVLNLIDRTNSYITDEEGLDFMAFAAHELRGPITVIKGYLDVLEDELSPVLKGDQPDLFHRLVVSSNRLSSYINNILNTSRYDRRHLKVRLSEGRVFDVYNMIKEDMALRASSQKRLLSIDIPSDLPTIAVDMASMSEVFCNLIDNAIKYSHEGGLISVTGRVNGEFVDISVKDNGTGMTDSVVRNLFQKFYRSHTARETVSGTGIGLYISKAIVESHGGIISVRSEEGKGSNFTVSIPIYSTVADKLKALDNSNVSIISEGKGWINNHSMFRG